MSPGATVHASTVLLGERGVLIRGAAGSGKSSLLLAILSANPTTAWLVADDRVALRATNRRLIAVAPEAIAGLLEIRGQGVVQRRHVSPAQVHLVVDLRPLPECSRLPAPEEEIVAIDDIVLPRLVLPVGTADGPSRVGAALERLCR